MSAQFNRTVGMWIYQNGGGKEIEQKLINKLQDREINTLTGLDLRYCEASKLGIRCKGFNLFDIDLFFSYNAGEQTLPQIYFYEQLNKSIPTINSFEAFHLSEDKFQTNMALTRAGIRSSDFFLCHRENPEHIRELLDQWGKMVLKPIDGWGGVGMSLIENVNTLDAIIPFLNQMDIRQYYIEKYIKNDHTDFRVDIVDGEFVSCYGRVAKDNDWRTNITSGGHIILREANDEVVDIAIRAAKALNIDIAGVDILYDQEREEYIVLEVNGIPAFATPMQEEMGLNFNDEKIEKIANLIDRKTARIYREEKEIAS